ncbi:MAG: tetraacyldisaccharide 4'-kinase [Nitrospinota bacterium]
MSLRGSLLRALEGEESAPLWARAASASLAPAGWAYGGAMRLRRRLYASGWREAVSPPCPVISVGNLTLGGTGKTPAVAWVLSKLIEADRRPAVVSRGYGGEAEGVSVVSDGAGAVLSAPPASDEAVMLARMFPSVPAVAGRDRPAAVRCAAELGADVIVADDGFQHIALERALDLVVLRGEHPFGNGRVFPAGALREPAAALRSAGAVLLTGGESSPTVSERIREQIGALAPRAKVFEGSLRPVALLDISGRPAGSPADLSGAAVAAVSGIGNPAGFARTLEGLGARVLAHHIFPDHAAYGAGEAVRIASSLDASGVDFWVTTEKDAVKLGRFSDHPHFRVLRVEMEVREGAGLARLVLDAAGQGGS